MHLGGALLLERDLLLEDAELLVQAIEDLGAESRRSALARETGIASAAMAKQSARHDARGEARDANLGKRGRAGEERRGARGPALVGELELGEEGAGRPARTSSQAAAADGERNRRRAASHAVSGVIPAIANANNARERSQPPNARAQRASPRDRERDRGVGRPLGEELGRDRAPAEPAAHGW